MTRFRTLDHPMMQSIAWDPERPAEWINDHIAMVHGTSNAYVITSGEGDVVINTTTVQQAPRARAKFEALLGRPLKVAKLIFTQSHPDHTGGFEVFAGPDTEVIVQREFRRICDERKLLGPFFTQRNARVLAALIPPGTSEEYWFNAKEPEDPATFADSHDFTSSGRRYHLFSLSSGETEDALGVWLPDEKTLFFGNWAGAIYGALPNFYTARGDRDRSVTRWLEHCEHMIALAPELLITGHDAAITGTERIRADLTKLRDAVRYIHDETVKGMNAQKDLTSLQAEITLPASLTTAPGRGPVSWYVRAVWEEYAGWFRHDSTTELYPVSPSTIWPEIAELAGGATVLVARAQARLARGQAVEALHLLEIAQASAPDDRAVLEAELAAFEMLADRTEGKIFDQLGWLEGRIIEIKRALEAGH